MEEALASSGGDILVRDGVSRKLPTTHPSRSSIMETRAFIRLLLSSLLVISALIQLPARGGQAPAAPDVPKLAFEKFTLPNGLEVILHQDRRLPIVAVNVWYHVGPANEEPGLTGFAHLFEHLM